MMIKHFITLEMPGSFFPENSSEEVPSWDVALGRKFAAEASYRRPFAFYFSTQCRRDDELNSRRIARSGRYYLGGEVVHAGELDDLDPDYRILKNNLAQFEGQLGIRCITGNWQPFLPEDTLLEEVAWVRAT